MQRRKLYNRFWSLLPSNFLESPHNEVEKLLDRIAIDEIEDILSEMGDTDDEEYGYESVI